MFHWGRVNTLAWFTSGLLVVGIWLAKPRGVPDLVAEGVTVESATDPDGTALAVRFAVRNEGSAAAGPTRARLRLGRGQGASTLMDMALADVEVPQVPVGQMVNLSTRVHLGRVTVPGSYYVWVIVDNDVARSVLVTVPAPE